MVVIKYDSQLDSMHCAVRRISLIASEEILFKSCSKPVNY